MTWLCDTNVLSELARRAPDPAVIRWARAVSTIRLSAITLEELTYGLSWTPNPRIQGWLERFLRDHAEVIPVTHEVALRAGQLRGRLRASGRPWTQADMLVAATASVHALTLVTRNVRDFDGTGIALLNPFEG